MYDSILQPTVRAVSKASSNTNKDHNDGDPALECVSNGELEHVIDRKIDRQTDRSCNGSFSGSCICLPLSDTNRRV